MPHDDLTGMVFGHLTVLGRVMIERKHHKGPLPSRWLCRCKCGAEVVKKGKYLKNGDTTSCGCIKGDVAIANGKLSKGHDPMFGTNSWQKMGDVLKIDLGGGRFTIIDEDRSEVLVGYVNYCKSLGYARVNFPNGKRILLHRLITGTQNAGRDIYIHHLNEDKLDNREANLLVTSPQKHPSFHRRSNAGKI